MTPAKTLAKALARLLGPTAVLSYQDGVKLPGQFITVAVPTNTPIGQAERAYSNDPLSPDLLEKISAFREVTYSVQVHRNLVDFTAADTAENIRLVLQATRARAHMLKFGLAYSKVSPTRDLTEMVDAAQEPRFQFEVTYNTVQTLTEVVTAIESIDITGRYQGAFVDHEETIQMRKP